ncbi:uncharacterized protein LOC113304331 [Papaver somniferum]|uniref:uncharacterized protein LOC113304331 n=1 Tax=Papaver somniferum TaxID=3469 RepID=UPI000E6F80AD|nr:uncharacterized protein LOC113304331 [Papaver somniferum]XP_026409198.1 uncharacterized protein LOC113304331 [Papaver somniferum]XP_026409199.1 uncharacterized protein LOC113304331 [Papaver somniferum]
MKADGEVMTWNRFKDLFMDKYVPDAARDKKNSEFMSLTKGGMSVSAYNDKFIRLSRYGADLITTDEVKAKRFIRALDPEMRKHLSCLRIKTYEDALNRSLDYEKEMEDQLAARVRERPQQLLARSGPAKRPMLSASNQIYFRPQVRPWSAGSTSLPPKTRPPTVRPQGRWVRFHQVRPTAQASSNLNSYNCFTCGEGGHIKKDCPRNLSTRLNQQGAVYAMESVVTPNQETLEESQVFYTMVKGDGSATDQVVEGKILLFNHLVHVLIDTGSTQSFINLSIATELGLDMACNNKLLALATPLGRKTFPFRVCKKCVMMVNDQELFADLVVLEMCGFDVILGMDWVAKYHASADFYAKVVTFHLPGQSPFAFVGSVKSQSLFQKLEKAGGENGFGLLACVTEDTVTIEYILVVCEFKDIIPDVLPGLPDVVFKG